jgi:tRNA G10  N-methylase Trm11
LKNDEAFILSVVKENEHALCYASDRLKNGYAIVFAAVKNNVHALNYAS